MARILLVDPSDAAHRALRAILAGSPHDLAAVKTAGAGRSFLRRNAATDLVFTGLPLEGRGNGLTFLLNLRADSILGHLPVVIYTAHRDRTSLQCAVAPHVQHLLLQPFHADDVLREIDQAMARPWRNRFFAEEASFCRQTSLTPPARELLLAGLYAALGQSREQLCSVAERIDFRPIVELIYPLQRHAESAGARVVTDALAPLVACVSQCRLSPWPDLLAQLDLAALLVADRLGDPQAAPDFPLPAGIPNGV